MNPESYSDTPLPELKFLSLKYHWERDRILIGEAVRADGTVLRFETRDENEIKHLAKLVDAIEAHIQKWNQIEKEAGRKF